MPVGLSTSTELHCRSQGMHNMSAGSLGPCYFLKRCCVSGPPPPNTSGTSWPAAPRLNKLQRATHASPRTLGSPHNPAVGIATPAVLTANLAEGCNGYISSVVLQVGLSGKLDPVRTQGGLVLAACSALRLIRALHLPPLCAIQHDLVPRFSVYNLFAMKQVSIDAVGRRHLDLHAALRLPCKACSA